MMSCSERESESGVIRAAELIRLLLVPSGGGGGCKYDNKASGVETRISGALSLPVFGLSPDMTISANGPACPKCSSDIEHSIRDIQPPTWPTSAAWGSSSRTAGDLSKEAERRGAFLSALIRFDRILNARDIATSAKANVLYRDQSQKDVKTRRTHFPLPVFSFRNTSFPSLRTFWNRSTCAEVGRRICGNSCVSASKMGRGIPRGWRKAVRQLPGSPSDETYFEHLSQRAQGFLLRDTLPICCVAPLACEGIVAPQIPPWERYRCL